MCAVLYVQCAMCCTVLCVLTDCVVRCGSLDLEKRYTISVITGMTWMTINRVRGREGNRGIQEKIYLFPVISTEKKSSVKSSKNNS